MGLMFYAPRKGCWAEQSAVVLQELKQWPDVNHMLRSPGSALCVGSSREPRGLSRATSRAQDPPAQLYWAVWVGVCSSPWTGLLLSLQSGSRFQNDLGMMCYQGLSSVSTKEIWMKSWDKEFKCVPWGEFFFSQISVPRCSHLLTVMFLTHCHTGCLWDIIIPFAIFILHVNRGGL